MKVHILKYQSIAKGTESGHSYLDIYLSSATIKENIVLLEGRIGQVNI